MQGCKAVYKLLISTILIFTINNIALAAPGDDPLDDLFTAVRNVADPQAQRDTPQPRQTNQTGTNAKKKKRKSAAKLNRKHGRHKRIIRRGR